MTPARLRELVARLPGAQEGAHHGHPDFRVRSKIFATLSADERRAALRLSRLEARELVASQPAVYRLVADREPFAWVSAPIDQVAEDEFAELLEAAYTLRSA